jgi:isopenicillin N synthase-like dioxygenase
MADSPGIPVVDLRGGAAVSLDAAAAAVAGALEHHGFMYVRGLELQALVPAAFGTARRFFAADEAAKQRCSYRGIHANFGYQGLEIESLDPANLPDLKETFTMRNALGLAGDDPRWPDPDFRDQALQFYAAALRAAHGLLAIMARALGLPGGFFTPLHGGENVTLRYLHYPAGLPRRDPQQLGAGEHTDYGAITLLFQDDVGGLEVRDRNGRWLAAPPLEGCTVINTGDLMERWTNGRFCSTPHRVRPIDGARDRYSIAMFVDPDSDVRVECIASCVTPERPARYTPISAGEHLYQRIAATHEARPP